jgi:hypothetical protein
LIIHTFVHRVWYPIIGAVAMLELCHVMFQ